MHRIFKNCNFFEGDEFGASRFFLVYIDIIRDKLNELLSTKFQKAAEAANKKIDELKDNHYQFWNVIAPMALLLNPSVPYNLLLTKEEVSRAKPGSE